jgi:2-polyprenyl-6-methoxyphenol hydroxylase-like FAD-dependent oxidoreductase
MGRRAVIAGCGVAGPAVALFLRRAGWEPVIYEAVEDPDAEAGVFLNLATNGLAVLDQLGLREQLLAGAHRCPTMVMWSGRGKRLGVGSERAGRSARAGQRGGAPDPVWPSQHPDHGDRAATESVTPGAARQNRQELSYPGRVVRS